MRQSVPFCPLFSLFWRPFEGANARTGTEYCVCDLSIEYKFLAFPTNYLWGKGEEITDIH